MCKINDVWLFGSFLCFASSCRQGYEGINQHAVLFFSTLFIALIYVRQHDRQLLPPGWAHTFIHVGIITTASNVWFLFLVVSSWRLHLKKKQTHAAPKHQIIVITVAKLKTVLRFFFFLFFALWTIIITLGTTETHKDRTTTPTPPPPPLCIKNQILTAALATCFFIFYFFATTPLPLPPGTHRTHITLLPLHTVYICCLHYRCVVSIHTHSFVTGHVHYHLQDNSNEFHATRHPEFRSESVAPLPAAGAS